MVKRSKTVATDTSTPPPPRRVGSCNEQSTEPGHRLSPLCFGHRFPTLLGVPLLKALRLIPQVLAASCLPLNSERSTRIAWSAASRTNYL